MPFPAGGGARIIRGAPCSKKLADRLGQAGRVENIPGAGGNKGTAVAARANPDGYTPLWVPSGLLLSTRSPTLHWLMTPKETLFPLHFLSLRQSSWSRRPLSRHHRRSDLIDLARANPGILSYASNGNGSPEHVAGELFKKRLKLEIRHLPYDGAGPARKAVLSGQASLMFDPCKGALPQSGRACKDRWPSPHPRECPNCRSADVQRNWRLTIMNCASGPAFWRPQARQERSLRS